MLISKIVNKPGIKKLGLTYMDPNYIFFNKFTSGSVAFDIGCGYEAEFAQYLVKDFQMIVYAVDPTRKHVSSLKKIQDSYNGKFIHLQNALSTKEEEIEFYETAEHESGSLLTDHVNVKNDTIQSYKVKTITLEKLPEICGKSQIDFVKIDIEGIEFILFENIKIETLKPFKQVFVEFHHYSVDSYSRKHTLRIIQKLTEGGMKYFTLDQVNYLFYWD
jgi:FkbM family methyltransferase